MEAYILKVKDRNGRIDDAWNIESIHAEGLLNQLEADYGPGRLYFPGTKVNLRVTPRDKLRPGVNLWVRKGYTCAMTLPANAELC